MNTLHFKLDSLKLDSLRLSSFRQYHSSPPRWRGLGWVLRGLAFWQAAVIVASMASGLATAQAASAQEPQERIALAADGLSFVRVPSGKPFRVWGVNYDHDTAGRLLEDYWHAEWPTVEQDFEEMQALGANVVRMHLQFGKFMEGPDQPNEQALAQLKALIQLAEKTGTYLDITGLGCYHKKDVPAWYDALDESARWRAQAHFWQAVARCGAGSPAIFCYDLMNEPVVPGGQREPGQWLGPDFAGKHFVQFVTLDQAGRPRAEIAKAWVKQLAAAVREVDSAHLVTVGLVDWSLDRPGLTSGFVPSVIAQDLDFLCVHIYPEAGKSEPALETLRGFNIGKPVVIEETFPLRTSTPELLEFIRQAKPHSAGVISFYWGTPAEEIVQDSIGAAILKEWLTAFQTEAAAESGR